MGAQKLYFFELFELRDYVVAKKSPDIEQKNDPAREQPRFPSDAPDEGAEERLYARWT